MHNNSILQSYFNSNENNKKIQTQIT